ncbi:sigma-70 family RNA polymerase sigma factor [Anaplasmataceae bacterium AB001_6]|nr:sigma-70 family RNA polymerase sigma factor [Anaplasmataceae bacterium AB001_6]
MASLISLDCNFLDYVSKVEKFPLLTLEEEKALVHKLCFEKDISAAHQLVCSHLRLVVKIARGFVNYGTPIMDLIAEGNIGLMKAVRNFDPKFGNRLSTYAMWWIKSSIQEYILRNWSIVRRGTVKAHRKLFFNFRKLYNKITLLSSGKKSGDEINQEIAQSLSVKDLDVNEMSLVLNKGDMSLNYTGGDGDYELQDRIPGDAGHDLSVMHSQDNMLRKRKLEEAIAILDERHRYVLMNRRLLSKPVTLEELSKKLSVSRERVRQIEQQAMKKVINYCQKDILV